MIIEKIKEIFETCKSLGFEKDSYNSSIWYTYELSNVYDFIVLINCLDNTIYMTLQEKKSKHLTLLYYISEKDLTEQKADDIIQFIHNYTQLQAPLPVYKDLKIFNNLFNSNYNNNYYQLNIKNNDFDVNDILQALDKKMKDNNINCSRIEFNYLSNAIEYLLRSFFKGQKESDLKKAISEIQFILNKENE